MSSAPRFIPSAFTPTDEQREIQTARDKVILVEANAGAAKTTTLALRIGESLARGVAPQAMLALVFTEEAREVMRLRLLEVGIAPALAAAVRIETFDSLAQAVLNAYEGLATPAIESAQALRGYVLTAIGQVSSKYQYRYDSLEIATHNLAISQFLDIQLSIKARLALPEDGDLYGHEETAELMGVTLTHLLTFLAYEELRLGAFDEAQFRGPFDATYDLARYLSLRPEIADALPACQTIVCDELHDMNEAVFRILMALLGRANAYFVGAGDKDQVIHATLGADAQYLRERFDQQFAALCRLPLSTTYRHGPHLALAMGKFKNKASLSGLSRDTDIPQQHYPAGDWQQGGELVVQAIRQWEKEKNAASDCAILIRDSHQSIAIENALIAADIGYRCHGLSPYLQRPEILFMRGMLAIALGDLASVQAKDIRKAIVEALVLFGEVDLSEVYFSDVDRAPNHQAALDKSKTLIADDPDILRGFFAGLFTNKPSASRQRIVDVVAYVQSLPADAPADAVLKEIWQRMRLDAIIQRLYVYPQEVAVVTRSAQGFMALASRAGLSLQALSAWIGRSEATVTKRKSKNRVTLERVATAKGKEYGHVILPFLEKGEFPARNALDSDEANLFYVGATRAKARLTLLLPDEPAQQSVFVGRMGLGSGLAAKAEAARERNADEQTSAETALAAAATARAASPRRAPRSVLGKAVERTDLLVSYAAKDQAKALGARWDAARKTWFVEAGTDLAPFKDWLKPQ